MWAPNADEQKECSSRAKPRYCLHFKRRGWCVRTVKENEQTFGKTWFFNETHGRDNRTDHLFCQQYRFNDMLQNKRGGGGAKEGAKGKGRRGRSRSR